MPATVGEKRYRALTRQPTWSLSRWGYFTGGAHWKDSSALYRDLRYRFLWETDIDLTAGAYVVRGVTFTDALVLDVDDAIAFSGISKQDLRVDVSQCINRACIAGSNGHRLSVFTHTIGWIDITVGLVFCEQGSIRPPKDMTRRGPSAPALTRLDLDQAILKER